MLLEAWDGRVEYEGFRIAVGAVVLDFDATLLQSLVLAVGLTGLSAPAAGCVEVEAKAKSCPSCFAVDEAVGAMRWEDNPLDLPVEARDVLSEAKTGGSCLAADAVVGAIR